LVGAVAHLPSSSSRDGTGARQVCDDSTNCSGTIARTVVTTNRLAHQVYQQRLHPNAVTFAKTLVVDRANRPIREEPEGESEALNTKAYVVIIVINERGFVRVVVYVRSTQCTLHTCFRIVQNPAEGSAYLLHGQD